MTTQTFKVVGITVHNGNAKVRFTDDMVRRVKQFTKGGASRVDFIELPSEMNKVDALNYMLTDPMFQSANDQATINDSLSDRKKETRKGEVKVKTKTKTKTAVMSLEDIKNRTKKTMVLDTTVEDILNVVSSDT